MTKNENYDIAVIGAGSAGTMAYLRAVLNNDRTVLFLGDAKTKKKGRGTWVSEVDNMPGFHDMRNPIVKSASTTFKWLNSQPDLHDRGQTIRAAADRIKPTADGYLLSYRLKDETHEVNAKYVIIATGVMDIQPLIGGSIEPIFPYGNRNDVLYCIRCDGHRVINHKLSIIGQDNSAVYIGAILKERYHNQTVQILTHGKTVAFSEEAQKLIKAYGFEVHPEEITQVLGDPKEKGLEGYMLGDKKIESTRSVVALGTIVYNEMLKQVGADLHENGRALVNSKTFETSVPNVFAVGDVVANRKMQIYTAWDEAVDAADEINRRIRNDLRQKALGSV